MSVGGKLKLIREVLYRLERSFGCPLAVYKQTPELIDLETGRAEIGRTSVEIKRAIVLPSKIHRGFSYDIGFLKANANFTYGGLYTDATRNIIINRKYLPKDMILDATDQFYVVYDGKRWEIKTVEEFEYKLAYVLTLTRVDGAIVNEIITRSVRECLDFDEDFAGGTDSYQEIDVEDTLAFQETVVGRVQVRERHIYDELNLADDIDTNYDIIEQLEVDDD